MKRILIIFSMLAILPISGFGSERWNIVDQLASDMSSGWAKTMGITFNPGDTAHYNLNMGFVKGTMDLTVDSVGSDGVWIHQLLNLGFLGNQDAKMLIDPNTGEIKKYIVNGKEQAPPKRGNMEVVETKEDTITVPAGTFTCLYVKVIDKDQNQTVEQWVNPKLVPVFGLVKSIAPSNLGQVIIELVSSKRG